MSRLLLLDAGPLGMVATPRQSGEFGAWYVNATESADIVVVPEISDYEVRRELIRARLELSVARLNAVRSAARFEPITSGIMLLAAQLWAEARNRGQPTAASDRLDADAILAATAVSLQREGQVVVVTLNVGHLSQFVDARHWSDISFE